MKLTNSVDMEYQQNDVHSNSRLNIMTTIFDGHGFKITGARKYNYQNNTLPV